MADTCVKCGDNAASWNAHPTLCVLCADRSGVWAPEPHDPADSEYRRTATWHSWPDVDSSPLGGQEVDTRWTRRAGR